MVESVEHYTAYFAYKFTAETETSCLLIFEHFAKRKNSDFLIKTCRDRTEKIDESSGREKIAMVTILIDADGRQVVDLMVRIRRAYSVLVKIL